MRSCPSVITRHAQLSISHYLTRPTNMSGVVSSACNNQESGLVPCLHPVAVLKGWTWATYDVLLLVDAYYSTVMQCQNREFLAGIGCVSLRSASLAKALLTLCTSVELSNVHPMLKYEASGGSICTAIILSS